MISPLFRRLRGAAGLALAWAVSWGVTAVLIGAPVTYLVTRIVGYPARFLDLASAFALAGALTGAVSGLAFALLLWATNRNRVTGELPDVRFGALGALPALAIGILLFNEAGLIVATGLFGLAAGTGSLHLAHRAERQALAAGGGPGSLD